MTSSLRKKHLLLWFVIILGVPVLMFSSIVNIPEFPQEETIEKMTITDGTVLKSVKNDLVAIHLKKTVTGHIIEVEIPIPLKTASAAVYEIKNSSDKGAFIGQINTKGTYTFPSHKNISGIIVFDNIRNKEITQIKF